MSHSFPSNFVLEDPQSEQLFKSAVKYSTIQSLQGGSNYRKDREVAD